MKDLDFDELDRAVNSLISPGSAPASQPVSTPTNTPSTNPVSPVTPTLAPALAERRSSGRFMDVVHPSSDMRTSAVPPRPAAREAATITPPAESDTPEPAESSTKPTTSWPDPLDFNASKTTDSEPVTDTPSVDAPVAPKETSPLESPFLSDAKVEKRPLGAFSTEPSEEPAIPAPIAPLTDTKSEDSLPAAADKPKSSDHPIESDTPLPAELGSDLLSIEANESSSTTKSDAATPEAPIGPTSITQQYTEQPSTGDKPAGTVFDTEAYKKPATRAKKKKSGLLVILWIFLLLVVGAGVGAAVYFFVLPRL